MQIKIYNQNIKYVHTSFKSTKTKTLVKYSKFY